MKKIVTLTTNPSVDMYSNTDFVTDEKKLSCEKPLYNPGGGGINVSRAIKILGGESTAIFPKGNHTGNILKDLLKKEKVKQIPVEIKDSTRINFSVIEDKTNRQYRFNMPGSKLTKKEGEKIIKEFKKINPTPDYLVISGSLAPGLKKNYYNEIAKYCKKIDCKIIIDSSTESLKEVIKEGVFLIKPNLSEFLNLTDLKLKSEQQIAKKAQEIINENKTEIIVISLGAAGSLLVTEEYFEHICSPITPIESRVGAGDSMVAGITLKLAEEKNLKEAVYYGVSAGAAAVMTPGTELCRKKDTERLFRIVKKEQNE